MEVPFYTAGINAGQLDESGVLFLLAFLVTLHYQVSTEKSIAKTLNIYQYYKHILDSQKINIKNVQEIRFVDKKQDRAPNSEKSNKKFFELKKCLPPGQDFSSFK